MRGGNRAFSLIELVIALAILAAVTTIALRAAGNLQDQARYQSTVRSLNEIQAAIVGPVNQRNADGSALVTGFVADTGRLPLSNPGSDPGDPQGAQDPLNELISNPNGIPPYQPYTSNIDGNVKVWAGWQGPYLHLSAGPTYVRDGWGNSFHAYDVNGALIATVGTPIAQLASWGADHLEDAVHGNPPGSVPIAGNYNDDVSIPNPTITSTTSGFGTTATNLTITGQVTMNSGQDPGPSSSGPTPNPTTSSGTVPVAIWVDYIGPDFTQHPNPVADVPILVATANTGGVWAASYPSGAPITYSGQFSISASNVTIGPRVLKVYVAPASDTTFANVVSSALYTTTLNVTLVPGTQTINLVLPHYSP
ncbi:MAG: type II secretion system protein [Tepidisphaeraceae bacterium]|jgi:prepilin-type N-terminal cleavage/methylation domain-containing protein